MVIGVDSIDLEFLMEEFEVDENTAAEMLMALQAHRIVGHDMGEGSCDVLVHDLDELDNLLIREKHTAQAVSSEKEDLQHQEQQRLVERQRELNELEERAKSARKAAAAVDSSVATETEGLTPRRVPLVSTRSIADVRRGFIWAKVLDEPRFKRRWSARYR